MPKSKRIQVQVAERSAYHGCFQFWDAEGNALADTSTENEELRQKIEKAINEYDAQKALELIVSQIPNVPDIAHYWTKVIKPALENINVSCS